MRRMAPQHPTAGQWSGLAGHGAQECFMLDIAMLALGFGFFAAALGYTYACERL
jgi:hypothetical protein